MTELAAEKVQAALAAFRQGEPVVICDSEGSCRLAAAAQSISPERVAFLIRQSAGIITAVLSQQQLEAHGLAPIGPAGARGAVYSPIDLVTARGAAAKDRAATLKALCDTNAGALSFTTPGHTFPSRVAERGVLDAPLCGEAAYDLCRLAKLSPVAAMAEPMREDVSEFSLADAQAFAAEKRIPFLTVEQLCVYRQSQAGLLGGDESASVPKKETESLMWMEEVKGQCMIRFFSTPDPKVEIVAITKGDLQDAEELPVRVHSECFTGDILGSQRCDCGQQLHKFLGVMDLEPRSCLLYIRGHEGRGIGLHNKIRAYQLQDQGIDTVDANVQLGLPVDMRTYEDSLSVLRQMGVKSVKLYTNNPEKISALKVITKQVVALSSIPSEWNIKYLNTKRERLNHRTVLETFKLPTPKVEPSSTRIGIVYTTWNSYYVDPLVKAAQTRLREAGVRRALIPVPGANELISGCRTLMKEVKPDAIIVIGVLIRGSSDIYDVTCNGVTSGLTELNVNQDIPIIQGVLMCHDEDQAYERSHVSNPARAWADTALHMSSLVAQIVQDDQ